MKVSVIKYSAGNIRSVWYALNRLGVDAIVTDDAEVLNSSDKVIFPGVGEASSAMKYLEERKLDKVISSLRMPVLGICLGMQLLCEHSEEGNTKCLGIIKTKVKKFGSMEGVKVPRIGWDKTGSFKGPLFDGLGEKEWMYFVHSYYAEKCNETVSTADYIKEYSSALQKNNFYAVQFHPEKSGKPGSRLLENFLKL